MKLYHPFRFLMHRINRICGFCPLYAAPVSQSMLDPRYTGVEVHAIYYIIYYIQY